MKKEVGNYTQLINFIKNMDWKHHYYFKFVEIEHYGIFGFHWLKGKRLSFEKYKSNKSIMIHGEGHGRIFYLNFPSAKSMRFNEDGTIDMLIREDQLEQLGLPGHILKRQILRYPGDLTEEELREQNKLLLKRGLDYWLRFEVGSFKIGGLQ